MPKGAGDNQVESSLPKLANYSSIVVFRFIT